MNELKQAGDNINYIFFFEIHINRIEYLLIKGWVQKSRNWDNITMHNHLATQHHVP